MVSSPRARHLVCYISTCSVHPSRGNTENCVVVSPVVTQRVCDGGIRGRDPVARRRARSGGDDRRRADRFGVWGGRGGASEVGAAFAVVGGRRRGGFVARGGILGGAEGVERVRATVPARATAARVSSRQDGRERRVHVVASTVRRAAGGGARALASAKRADRRGRPRRCRFVRALRACADAREGRLGGVAAPNPPPGAVAAPSEETSTSESVADTGGARTAERATTSQSTESSSSEDAESPRSPPEGPVGRQGGVASPESAPGRN